MNFIADSLLLGTLSGVRVFEALHFQACTEPIRLFIFSYISQIVKDESAVWQQRETVGLPTETRITFTFCGVVIFLHQLYTRFLFLFQYS